MVPRLPGTHSVSVRGTLPALRVFARFMTGDMAAGDSLVRETLRRAIAEAVDPGDRLEVALLALERKLFHERERPAAGEAHVTDCNDKQIAPAHPVRPTHDALRALQRLRPLEREAFVLTAVMGLSSETCARICACTTATAGERVDRARDMIAERGELRL